jgi:hypothetical protein
MKDSKQNSRGTKQLVAIGKKHQTVVNPDMVDLSNDPYFVAKAERAKKLLNKYGAPKRMK